MQLNVRDAARLLRVSTKTIYRWLSDGKIPGYRVNSSFRFDRAELVEWATATQMSPAPALLQEPVDLEPLPTFEQALDYGGITYRVEGGDRDAALRAVVRTLRVDESERDLVFEALRAREELAPTTIGDGIALPHLRNPLRFHFRKPSVALCFLEHPIDWHAPDGEPVHVLLVVTGSTVRQVLRLHSQTYFALRQEPFRAAIREQHAREAILTAARSVDATFQRRLP
jgi:PTS system nitrogen regulatory IIA component